MCFLKHDLILNDILTNSPLLKAITMSKNEKNSLKGKQCSMKNVEKTLDSILKQYKILESDKETESINIERLVSCS